MANKVYLAIDLGASGGRVLAGLLMANACCWKRSIGLKTAACRWHAVAVGRPVPLESDPARLANGCEVRT